MRLNLCLEAVDLKEAVLKPCDITNRKQLWRFQFYSQDYKDIMEGKSEKFEHITKLIKHWKEERLVIKKQVKKSSNLEEVEANEGVL